MLALLVSHAVSFVLTGTSARPSRSNLQMYTDPWPLSTLLQRIDAGSITRAAIATTEVQAIDTNGDIHTTAIFPSQVDSIVDALSKHGVEFGMRLPSMLQSLIANNLPFLLFIGVLAYLQGSGLNMATIAKQFRGTSSSSVTHSTSNTSFADVAGTDEMKRELYEIVDFLRGSQRFINLRAEIPRGVLLEGPPGTGKTLLARAVAGEAKVPFVATTGSDFVELYVGLGASRVRDLFRVARENAPSILFIDEIDAVGKRRGAGMGNIGGNDEREQTLNAILSEMDGFKQGDAPVIVLACTNRIDTLDPALVRPGRFDRRVTVPLPNTPVRKTILEVHARDRPMSAVNLTLLAQKTPGFSGADLRAVCNEAAINAARANRSEIVDDDVCEAVDRLTLGVSVPETRSYAIRKRVAIHESGHSLMAILRDAFQDELKLATIRARANGAGGYTQFLPSSDNVDSGLETRSSFEARLDVMLGGAVAEEVIYGVDGRSNGASSDLQSVRDLAKKMVLDWQFYDAAIEETAIAAAVAEVIDEAFHRTRHTLGTKKSELISLADALLRMETLSADQMRTILASM